MNYKQEPTPGDFDHRSGECPEHGDNVVVFRPKGQFGRYQCVACALEVLKMQEEK